MTIPDIEIIIDGANLCGEAPIWDASRRRLVWVDANSSLVFEFYPRDGKTGIISRGLQVSGIAINVSGGLVFAGNSGIHLWQGQDDYQTIAREHAGELLVFNDIAAGPGGRVYAGTLYWSKNGMDKTGKLCLLDPDGSTRVMDEGFLISNGLGFSPDESTLYYADSGARRIYAYQVDRHTGELTNRRDFVRVPIDEGIPDGLTVDAEGYVWSAQWYGGQVVRYDPDGKVERRISRPVAQVSSVAFGGEDLTDLYITTAGEYWPSEHIPPGFNTRSAMGGELYRIRLDIQGKPEYMSGFSDGRRS